MEVKFKYDEGLEKQAREKGYTFRKNKKDAEKLRKAFNLLKENDCIPTEMIDLWIEQRVNYKLCSMLVKKG